MTNILGRTISGDNTRVVTGWTRFDSLVRLRPGWLVHVFAQTSVGKSMWALNLAHRVGVPVLYSTTDTDLGTQARRAWALEANVTTDEVEESLEFFSRKYYRQRRGLAPIEWNDVQITAEEFPDLVFAVTEYLGQVPRFVIVDVMTDIVKERSLDGYKSAFNILKNLARETRCTVIAIHHTKKGKRPTKPVFLTDYEYAGGGQPDIVIGMHRPTKGTVVAAMLKNRLGPSSPDGSINVRFHVDYTRARVEEW